ncbi:MAG: hypothetical protein ACLP5H_02280 [Desulfomonilaceae bacterium]
MLKNSGSPRFVCPRCGCEQLMEVRLEVYKPITAINADNFLIVYDQNPMYGVGPRGTEYRCRECEYVVRDPIGNPIDEVESLAIWLRDQAAARREGFEFTCPHCGGSHLLDRVAIDSDGHGERSFDCGDCGALICDEEERVMKMMLEWEQMCAAKRKDSTCAGDPCGADSGQTG